MRLQIRPGAVVTKMCEEYLIICAREARQYCPAIMQINETGAYILKKIEEGCSEMQIIESIQSDFSTELTDEIKHSVREYLNALKSNGILMEGTDNEA